MIQQPLLSLLLFDGKVKLDATAILIVLLNAPEPMFKSGTLAIWIQEHLFWTTESSSPKFHYNKQTSKYEYTLDCIILLYNILNERNKDLDIPGMLNSQMATAMTSPSNRGPRWALTPYTLFR